MKVRRRRCAIPPAKAMDALGFYRRLPVPEKITCCRCGEERNSIGQADGVCLKCRWAMEAERRMSDGQV